MSTLADLQRRNIAQMESAASEHSPDISDTAPNNTTILQSDKPTNPQTYRPTDQQTSRQADKPTSRQTKKPSKRPTDQVLSVPTLPVRPARIDGRTLRVRQDTADQTMVTSMRLAVSTLELLDDYCYRHRRRKQDVVQAALDMYFAAEEDEYAESGGSV